MHINELARVAYENSRDHGFHTGPDNISEKLMLTVTELAEALEEIRKHADPKKVYYRAGDDKPEGFVMELADAVIRIGDLAHALGLDLEAAILEKHAFNKSRPYKHGKRF